MSQQVSLLGGLGTLGEVTIPDSQVAVHKTFEALAVVVAAPFSIWLATRKELPTWARVLSATIGVGTWIVDGGLLWQYLKK
jgi:hypothetical protein